MDHIPNTMRPAHKHIPVPYLFNNEWGYKYDNQGFRYFPERQGFDSNAFLPGSLIHHEDKERAASLLQEWLYFGLMSEAMNRQVDTSDFVDMVGGQSFINTKLLPKYIDDWQLEIASLQEDDKEARFQAFLRLCRDAEQYLRGATKTTPDSPPPILSEAVQLSLSLLHATIVFAAAHIFRNGADPSPSNLSEFVNGIPVEPLKNLLRKQYWCPSDIALLEQGGLGSTSSIELYYAYLLGDRRIIRDHTQCESAFTGQFVCKALNVDEKNYKQRHTDGCQGGCEVMTTDESRLAEAYLETSVPRVPLVTVSVNNAGLQSLEMHTSDFGTKYVAVSHVYADGLGNPQECGLPACQLKQLQSRVNAIYSQGTPNDLGSRNIPFWMDTLCIPVEKGETKTAAIRKMAQIYSMAASVLVLNGELEYHSHRATPEEILMRIASSAWFRRLWTLQEGVLANSLHFQFQDGSVEIESLELPQENRSSQFSILKRLRGQALKPYKRIRAFRELSREQRIRAIYPLVQWRATTHEADEPYCLATLLLEDNNAIHEVTATKDYHKRRVEFIFGQKLFPVKSLFFGDIRIGTRDPPIGWALRSYLYRSAPEAVHESDTLALISKEGLHVNLCGVSISISDLPTDHSGQHQLPSFTIHGEMTTGGEESRLQVSSCFWLRDQNHPRVWANISHSLGVKKVGILFEEWPLEHQDPSTGRRSFLTTRGAIVAITEETRHMITGLFCGTAIISTAPVPSRAQACSMEELDGLVPGLSKLLEDVELMEILQKSGEDTPNWGLPANLPTGNYASELRADSHSPGITSAQKNDRAISGRYIQSTTEWCIK